MQQGSKATSAFAFVFAAVVVLPASLLALLKLCVDFALFTAGVAALLRQTVE